MNIDGLRELTLLQHGVLSRRQLVGLGAADHEIARMIRRRDVVRVHRGVFVNHAGPRTRAQREWAAVLVHWPAALARESALPLAGDDRTVHVAIDLRRSVTPVSGVVAHRTADLQNRVTWAKAPPQVRIEHAIIDGASSRREDPVAVFRLLADVCQTRRTSATRIANVLRGRRGARGAALIAEVLSDLAVGACSVLEREYLHAVEQAHGLPQGRRQRAVRRLGSSAYRDVDYEDFGLIVELDGRAFHDTAAARDRDADRDLDARFAEDRTTVRLTFGLVLGAPCRTAQRIGALLQRHGWSGQLVPCQRCAGS